MSKNRNHEADIENPNKGTKGTNETYDKMTDMDNMVTNITRTMIKKGKDQHMIKEDINNEVLVEMVSVFIKNMVINQQTATRLNISNNEVFDTFINVIFDGTLSEEGKKQYEQSISTN